MSGKAQPVAVEVEMTDTNTPPGAVGADEVAVDVQHIRRQSSAGLTEFPKGACDALLLLILFLSPPSGPPPCSRPAPPSHMSLPPARSLRVQ